MNEKLDTIISLLSRIADALENGAKAKRSISPTGKGAAEIEYNALFGVLRLQNPVFAGMTREQAASACLQAGCNADAYAKNATLIRGVMELAPQVQADSSPANADDGFDEDDL